MTFILRNNGHFYLAKSVKVGTNKWTNKIIRRATQAEIDTYYEVKKHRRMVVVLICDNPFCDNLIKTTRKHKIRLNTDDPKKGRLEFVYCSKECRQKHLNALTGE